MDFIRYAERSAGLLNAEILDAASLRAHLSDRADLARRVTERDGVAVQRFQRQLRAVFEASDLGDTAMVVDLLNELMARNPITPRIVATQDDLHISAALGSQSVAEHMVSEALLGLATLVCDLGPSRLGTCAATSCSHVYVDTSPNSSRRYCSERCSSRANVAAYRARQRETRSVASA